MKPTSPPCAGELRQIQSFDIRLSTLTDATVDILFSRDQVQYFHRGMFFVALQMKTDNVHFL